MIREDFIYTKYCCEDISLIENYELAINDLEDTWHCHHRFEIQDDKILTKKELINLGLYYDRPAKELIFLTAKDHISLHQKGKQCSEETKQKMSLTQKGKHLSEETKQKISEGNKGIQRSEETKQKMRKPKSEETKQKMRDAWIIRKMQNNLSSGLF